MGQEYNEKVFFGPHTIHPSGCWLTLPGLAMGQEYNGKKVFLVCTTSILVGARSLWSQAQYTTI